MIGFASGGAASQHTGRCGLACLNERDSWLCAQRVRHGSFLLLPQEVHAGPPAEREPDYGTRRARIARRWPFDGRLCRFHLQGPWHEEDQLEVAVVLGLFFGGFQAGMPVIGWALGSQFMGIIGPIDHWIAFILLAFIGGKMLWEAFTEDEDEGDGKDAEKIDLGEYLILAIATSIDALAVGISFAALSVDIVSAVSLIGITTFVFSVAGVAIGHTFGARYEKPATIVGGVVLILIGLKILLEHLGFLVL